MQVRELDEALARAINARIKFEHAVELMHTTIITQMFPAVYEMRAAVKRSLAIRIAIGDLQASDLTETERNY